MFATIGRSWELFKVCWRILQHDKELMLFPLLSTISLIFTFTLIFATGLVDRVADSADQGFEMIPADYVILGICYFISYFIIIYFNAALIGAARIRLQGGDPTLRDGFQVANRNLMGIIGWAAISAIVSLIFYAINKFARRGLSQHGGAAMIVLLIVGLVAQVAWSVITYLVIPVLVAEGIGPIQAIKRSASLLRKTWGEQLVSNFGFDIMVIILAIPIVVVVVVVGVIIPQPAGVVIAVALGVTALGALILITAALRGIYVATLYEYATTGSVPQLLPERLVVDSWTPRSAR